MPVPDWLTAIVRDVVREILHAELVKHGVITPAATPPPQ